MSGLQVTLMRNLPARHAPALVAFLLSGVMSLLVSSLAVTRQVGWVDGVLGLCVQSWLPAWGLAFLIALVLVRPIQELVGLLVEARG